MLDMYIFETTQLVEQIEQVIIDSEKVGSLTEEAINEVFRIMHTIKGSSGMMMFNTITTVAHSIEDLFYFLRENKSANVDCSRLSDIVLEGIDFIKTEVDKIIEKENPDGDTATLISDIKEFLSYLKENNVAIDEERINEKSGEPQEYINSAACDNLRKNVFKATIYFEDGCEMEDIRAFSIINDLNGLAEEIYHIPEEVFGNEKSIEIIRNEGFKISFNTDKGYEEIHKFFTQIVLLKEFKLIQEEDNEDLNKFGRKEQDCIEENPAEIPCSPKIIEVQNGKSENTNKGKQSNSSHQNIISVNVSKLDQLMDMIGELVISEAMVTQNPDLKGLSLDNFQKAARQLEKITGELQDIVMSIRMVPLAATFQKMNRIVRDMSKKLSKEVKLKIIGEDTEVDKNIIEHISDPLMHIVRNSIDHGLESSDERSAKGKLEIGTITLEARNEGGDVLIIISDDGKGLNREKVLARARENGLINRPENEIADKEVFSYIFLPGFSTKEKVTEFSGRGVGMDVVTKNINLVGGTVSIDSKQDVGTTITLKIPLTLATMDGMTIKVGKSNYTIPVKSIKESFRAKENDIIIDPDGNESIMIRGKCYSILRLHKLYKVKTNVVNISDGIIVMISSEDKSICIFADELIGQYQVVVKALPQYIKKFNKINGLSGCTLLGDGSISLILDAAGLINY
ncbi:chemotaxis protein CheA [Clostridium saccharobutylicum DSM 13864]|uniref:Chemotaxis protein CheA n=2 Tax=Clostridium saccharobutylicum TaxID=169679 RepID=U5MSC9_CLOSA|nr:chemotaxis protein CheA [Clostridium saccharobutylicum DSM 13864]